MVCEICNSSITVTEDTRETPRGDFHASPMSTSNTPNAKYATEYHSYFKGELPSTLSRKSSSLTEQMSESGLSNDDETKIDQVQDGRWTREEHYCFLKAVAIYGREWKLVQTAIKTRTSAQIRSHAQKYFQKCAKQEQSHSTTGVSEDAFVVLELCERVLKTLKKKRDDYNIANNVPVEDSDQEGSTENDIESINNSLNSSSSSVNTSNHSVYSFAYPVGEESTVLGRDELIALEFLCCNKKDNYSPLKVNKDDQLMKGSKSLEVTDSTSRESEESGKVTRVSPSSSSQQAFHNYQYKESLSSLDNYYVPAKRMKM